MWTPSDFEGYRALYPKTPPLPLPSGALTERFCEAWAQWSDDDLDARLRDLLSDTSVCFVRGFLGNWMPGNLVAPAKALRGLGIEARVLRNAAGATVEENVARLRPQLPEGRLLLCGHSKGGLECLRLADQHPTVGVLLSQTPRGPSAVLASLLDHAHPVPRARRLEELSQRWGLHLIRAAKGGRQLTSPALEAVLATVDRPRDIPVWQTASWSSQPTTWLDSFHARLEEIRPGAAHDGQFFLEDLLWPDLPHVLLAHVDHAQPVMGGFGFDHVRYWKVLIALFAAAA